MAKTHETGKTGSTSRFKRTGRTQRLQSAKSFADNGLAVRPGQAPVRTARVEAARALLEDKGFDLDASLRKAMRKLLAAEFGA